MERRMELMWENRRWFDLMRWRCADILEHRPSIGFPYGDLMRQAVKRGDYFFPKGSKPEIDPKRGLVASMQPIIDAAKEHNGGTDYYVHPIMMNPDYDEP